MSKIGGNVKATLSLNKGVYQDFQSFCDAKAFMLSKKVELVIKNILEGKEISASNKKYTKKITKNQQQKVTLSIDGEVYAKFQKYCSENAIMLSKKIELIMINIMENGI
jgi:hypothetical protein